MSKAAVCALVFDLTKVICTGDPVYLWWFQIGEVGRTLRAVLEAEVVPSMTQLSDSLADWYKIAHTVYLKVNKHLLHTCGINKTSILMNFSIL